MATNLLSLMGVGTAVSQAAPPASTTWDAAHTDLTYIILSNGNLTAAAVPSANDPATRSIASHSAGKYYFEAHVDTYTAGGGNEIGFGFINASGSQANYLGVDNNSIGTYTSNNVYYGGSQVGTSTSFGSGATVSCAIDVGGSLFWSRVNGGNWNNSGTANPATGAGGISFTISGALYAGCTLRQDSNALQITAAFNSTSWTYTVPSGFSQM